MKFLSAVYYFAVISLYMWLSYGLFQLIYRVHPYPFIDETFHVSQVQTYCNGSFTKWNPKITTLPGLYIMSVGVIKLIGVFTRNASCDLYTLRSINLCVSIFILYLVYSNLKAIHSQPSKKKNYTLWNAVNISILPVLYFFSFLYYTDPISTFFVLFMYYFHLMGSYWTASVMGFMAILMRQTNVVWVGFMLLDGFHSRVISMTELDFHRLKLKGYSMKEIHSAVRYLKKKIYQKPGFIDNFCKSFGGYILLCALFLMFIYVNGGIVLGDKSAHEMVIHIPQIFYYTLFCFGFCFPHVIVYFKGFIKFCNTNRAQFMIACSLCAMIVHYNSLVHDYLIADNRHYTFYFWKRFYEQSAVIPYALIPVYLFVLYALVCSLKEKSSFFVCSYFLCLFMSVAPQKLLEFRYFIIPYIVFRLNLNCRHWPHLLCETVILVLINFLTVYVFVTKAFFWSDQPFPQRIIW